jgi:hypothetical protein
MPRRAVDSLRATLRSDAEKVLIQIRIPFQDDRSIGGTHRRMLH